MVIKTDKIKVRKPEHRQSKKGVMYWTFYISLGKNKGTLNCILWDAKLENLKESEVLEHIVGDLVKDKAKNGNYYDKLIITEYMRASEITQAEQAMDDISNDFEKEQEQIVDVNKEFANYDAFGLGEQYGKENK